VGAALKCKLWDQGRKWGIGKLQQERSQEAKVLRRDHKKGQSDHGTSRLVRPHDYGWVAAPEVVLSTENRFTQTKNKADQY